MILPVSNKQNLHITSTSHRVRMPLASFTITSEALVPAGQSTGYTTWSALYTMLPQSLLPA